MDAFNYEEFMQALEKTRAQRMTARPVLRLQVLHYAGEQIRRHRKKRINKKWRKRYGTYEGPLPNKWYAFVWDGCLITTRPGLQRIQEARAQIRREEERAPRGG